MPCSFECETSCEYARSVLSEVEKLDADYAAAIAILMRQPVLVVSEVLCYLLVGGRVSGEGVSYRRAVYAGGAARGDRFGVALGDGDELRVADGLVHVLRAGRLFRSLETWCDRGHIEVPLILPFE
jgi:hypothetical protein